MRQEISSLNAGLQLRQRDSRATSLIEAYHSPTGPEAVWVRSTYCPFAISQSHYHTSSDFIPNADLLYRSALHTSKCVWFLPCCSGSTTWNGSTQMRSIGNGITKVIRYGRNLRYDALFEKESKHNHTMILFGTQLKTIVSLSLQYQQAPYRPTVHIRSHPASALAPTPRENIWWIHIDILSGT